ncbi:MAG: hypothetical protein ACHREM_32175, partial [Polyangiales bacterium]
MALRAACVSGLALAAMGCSGDDSTLTGPRDGSAPQSDSGTVPRDSSGLDSGPPDAPVVDSSAPDSISTDSISPDADLHGSAPI